MDSPPRDKIKWPFISGGSTLLNIFSLYQGKLGNLWRSNTPELLCTMFGYTVW